MVIGYKQDLCEFYITNLQNSLLSWDLVSVVLCVCVCVCVRVCVCVCVFECFRRRVVI